MNFEKIKSTSTKIIVTVLLLVVIAVVATTSMFTVQTGEVAIMKRFGKVTGIKKEGLNYKLPFVDSSEIVVVKEQTIRFGEGEEYATLSASTRDMQTVQIELTVSDVVNDPLKLYTSFTGNHVNALLVPRIRDAVQSNVAKYTIEQFVAQRAALATNIFDELKIELEPYGITLTNVSITNHDFSDSYEAAVEAKKVAEQEVETERQKQEKKIVEAESAVKLAELEIQKKTAQAQANKIETESLSEQILTKYWIEKWNGQLPKVSSSDTGLIVTPELLNENPQ